METRTGIIYRANRIYNFLYSFIHGLFWVPCPLCNKKFGGQEWVDGNELWVAVGGYKGVCKWCGEKAKKMNQSNTRLKTAEDNCYRTILIEQEEGRAKYRKEHPEQFNVTY
jgi:hypothetical protein